MANWSNPKKLPNGADAGLTVENLSGLRYIPFGGHAALCRSTRMNYLMHFRR
jgi:2-polyprenyl-3-methyl-5-hydroxy-6-metoxy-1,4-benzoquinol methylase